MEHRITITLVADAHHAEDAERQFDLQRHGRGHGVVHKISDGIISILGQRTFSVSKFHPTKLSDPQTLDEKCALLRRNGFHLPDCHGKGWICQRSTTTIYCNLAELHHCLETCSYPLVKVPTYASARCSRLYISTSCVTALMIANIEHKISPNPR